MKKILIFSTAAFLTACGTPRPVCNEPIYGCNSGNERAALAAQPGAVGEQQRNMELLRQIVNLKNLVESLELLAKIQGDIIAAAPTEAKPAQQDAVGADMVLRAARELCRIHAGECQVNEQDTWNLYAEQFKRDADAVLRAAISAKKVQS